MNRLSFMFCILVAVVFTKIANADERVSIAQLLKSLPPEGAITAAYRQPQLEVAKVKAWTQSSAKIWQEFQGLVSDSKAFVRGEIEQESVMSSVTAFLQLSILQCRMERQEQRAQACSRSLPVWFKFAGDLAYEESSLVALRFSNLVRSLWLDEMESPSFAGDGQFFSSAQDWLWGLSAPWPVDRVFLSEGRKFIPPLQFKNLEKLAQDYQKNPYQTSEQMLKKLPGRVPAEFDWIKKVWRQEDLEAMKLEINRMNQLRIKAAKARYVMQQKKSAQSFKDLTDAKLVSQIPIDYFTGKPMDWKP